jgi:hypothetical protein
MKNLVISFSVKVTITAATVAYFCAFSSCSRKENEFSPDRNKIEYNNKLLASLRTIDGLNIRNAQNIVIVTNNTMNWVGVEHNNTLAYIAKNTNFYSKSSSIISVKQPFGNETTDYFDSNVNDRIKILSQKYWNEQAIPNNMTLEQVQTLSTIGISNDSERLMTDSIVSFLTTNKLKDPTTYGTDGFVKSAYQNMTLLVKQGKMTDFEAHADSILLSKVINMEDLTLAQNTIIMFENSIMSSNLPQVIKDRQLVHFSIFRNSLAYWGNVMNDQNNNWHKKNEMKKFIIDSSNARLPRWLKWTCIGFADAIGGILGGELGGGIGSAIGAGVGGAVASGIAEDAVN